MGIAARFCGVSMMLGRMQLTLMPLSRNSADMLSVSRITALFEALYAPMYSLPARPATAAMLTIFPRPAASIPGTTARAVLITDFALRSSISSQVSSGVSCTGCPMRKPPAILQRTSVLLGRVAATA